MESSFLNKNSSDLTISFPGHKTTYPVHRSIIAKATPYFQNLLYGPMSLQGQEWVVHDEYAEPEAFKIILAYCYEIELVPKDVDVALRVYKLADAYMLDKLKYSVFDRLTVYVKSDPSNAEQILKFSLAYNFLELKSEVLNCLSKMYNKHNKHVMFSNLLFNLHPEWRDELLRKCGKITELSFTESWLQPNHPLPHESISPILESTNCKDLGLTYFSGCISAQDFREIIWKSGSSNMLSLSLCNSTQAEEVARVLPNMDEEWYFYLHIPDKVVFPESLSHWPEVTRLYLSNSNDDSLNWITAVVLALRPKRLCLPKSTITFTSIQNLAIKFKAESISLKDIVIWSSNIPQKYYDPVTEWYKTLTTSTIKLCATTTDTFA